MAHFVPYIISAIFSGLIFKSTEADYLFCNIIFLFIFEAVLENNNLI